MQATKGDVFRRFLADDALEQVGAAAERATAIACSILEAYIEEVSLLGARPVRCCHPSLCHLHDAILQSSQQMLLIMKYQDCR